jgi:hypothetical protein
LWIFAAVGTIAMIALAFGLRASLPFDQAQRFFMLAGVLYFVLVGFLTITRRSLIPFFGLAGMLGLLVFGA